MKKSNRKLKILLSNDDGVDAPGLFAMYQELKRLGEVFVVAPTEEKSTTGHSLTIHKPLRIYQRHHGFHAVSGSPADCVYVGIREVVKATPDLVVSGINRGGNIGQDVYYSGTVSAAREACILGIPAMAVSLAVNFMRPPPEDQLNYAAAAKVAVQVIKETIAKEGLPHHHLLNVNVPDLPLNKIRGIVAARQGFRYYSGSVLRRTDHRGRPYFWVGGQYKGYRNEFDTDAAQVNEGFASVTPVQLDTTAFGYLEKLGEIYPVQWEAEKKKPRSSRRKT